MKDEQIREFIKNRRAHCDMFIKVTPHDIGQVDGERRLCDALEALLEPEKAKSHTLHIALREHPESINLNKDDLCTIEVQKQTKHSFPNHEDTTVTVTPSMAYQDLKDGVYVFRLLSFKGSPMKVPGQAKAKEAMEQVNLILKDLPWAIDLGMDRHELSIRQGGKEVFKIINIGSGL